MANDTKTEKEIIYKNGTSQRDKSRAYQIVEKYKNNLNYTNCNFWFVAVKDQPTKIEITWKGSSLENPSNTEAFKKLNQKISKIVEMLSDGVSDQDLKQKLREFALNDVLGDDE